MIDQFVHLFTLLHAAYAAAKLNGSQFGRFVRRAEDSKDSVFRLARDSSLTGAQSAALRSLAELYAEVTQAARASTRPG